MGKQPTNELEKCLQLIAAKFLSIIPPADRRSFNRIGFHVEAAWWFYTDYCRPARALPNLSFREFAPLLLSHQPQLLSEFGGLGAVPCLLDSFYNYRSQIPVCGAAILDAEGGRVLLVRGLHSASKWSFPRGKINAHEAAAACAIREVWEEIGYDISPLLQEDCKLEWVRSGQHPIRIYLVTLPPEHIKWPFSPRTKGEIGEIGWHRLEALRKFRPTYYDVSQFEKGLREYAKSKSSPTTKEDISTTTPMKRVDMQELFAAKQPGNDDPFQALDDVEPGALDPSERVLQIVDELKLTDWLPTPRGTLDESDDNDAQDLLDLLLAQPPNTMTTLLNKKNDVPSINMPSEFFPLNQQQRQNSKETDDDLLSLILFGKNKNKKEQND